MEKTKIAVRKTLQEHLLEKPVAELVSIILHLVKKYPHLELFVDDRIDNIEKRIKQLRYTGDEHPYQFTLDFRRVHALVMTTKEPLSLLLQLFDKILKILDTNEQWDSLDSTATLVAKSVNKELKHLPPKEKTHLLKEITEKARYQDFLLDYFDQ